MKGFVMLGDGGAPEAFEIYGKLLDYDQSNEGDHATLRFLVETPGGKPCLFADLDGAVTLRFILPSGEAYEFFGIVSAVNRKNQNRAIYDLALVSKVVDVSQDWRTKALRKTLAG